MKVEAGRVIGITGPITEQMAADVNGLLMELAMIDKKKPVYFMIDTPGGDVYAALSMCDMIKALDIHTVAICVGKVMSAGNIILSVMKERYTFPNATFMVHNILTEIPPMITDPWKIRRSMNNTIEQNNLLIKMITGISNLSIAQMQKLFDEETYFSAKEAIKYKMVKPLKGHLRVIGNKEETGKISFIHGSLHDLDPETVTPPDGHKGNRYKYGRIVLRRLLVGNK
jgi:ATP-dependent Clp protease protease subunit